jgi:S1-C subfamily serine protease
MTPSISRIERGLEPARARTATVTPVAAGIELARPWFLLTNGRGNARACLSRLLRTILALVKLDDDSMTPQSAPHLPVYRDSTSTVRLLAILLMVVAGVLIWTLLRQQVAPPGNGQSFAGPLVQPTYETPPSSNATPSEPRAITARGDLAADEAANIELFRSVAPSVVHITNLKERRDRMSLNALETPQGSGSGFLWDEQGHVVTNFHVIDGADRVAVTLYDNTIWPGTIVGAAKDKDLAVVKITAPLEKLRPISVGSSRDLQVGQKVFAIGNPFGLDHTLTTGIISGLNREIRSVTQRTIYDVIQTDAAINQGNSGGPLLDSAGRLIGVNTAIYSPSGAFAGIGFAVPADTVNRIVPQLVSSGRVIKPGLGISALRPEIAARYSIQGVAIMHVHENTPAAQAGLRGMTADRYGRSMLGDIIVGIDGSTIVDLEDLYRLLDQKNVGDNITLAVEREGKRVDVPITLHGIP